MAMGRGTRQTDTPLPVGGQSRARRAQRGQQPPPPGAPLPEGVRGDAIRDGERAAWSGQYDQWSFPPEADIPYLGRLDAECEQAVASGRARVRGALRAALASWSRAQSTARVDGTTTWNRLQTAARRRDRARDRERASLETLDHIAGASFSRLSAQWFDEDGDEIISPAADSEPDGTGRDAGASPSTGDDDSPAPGPFAMPRPPQAAWLDAPEPNPAVTRRAGRPRARYVGPATGRFAMLLPTPLRLGVLVALIAVEVPIYLKVFAYFTGGDQVLAWMFTVPVALGMVLAPHLAGKLHRRRQELPREPVIPFVTTAVMLLWLASGILLGWLRQKVLLVPRIDPLTGASIGLTDQLHLSTWTVTGLFGCLILISGLIAFMLGLGEAHPVVMAYQAAVRAAEDAEDAYDEAVARHAEAAEPVRVTREEIVSDHETEAADQEEATRAEYAAATEAYLDAYARETGDPNVTQATSTARSRLRP